ncbi:MAG: 50S ribosomal protein L3 [Opitutaceae bacterium]
MIQTILGTKLGMTQIYDENHVLVPVTVVQAGPCPVVQVKTVENDGYCAVQIGYGVTREHRSTKAEIGHLKKADQGPLSRLTEVRCATAPDCKPGDVITVAAFAEGQMVDVVGVTKGKGFQGVMKRFRVAGGPASHGSMFHRRIGSVGMRQTPGRVFKNQKMPGHMGSKRRTVQNLRIVKIDAEQNVILVRGALPGSVGSAVMVRAAIKTRKA